MKLQVLSAGILVTVFGFCHSAAFGGESEPLRAHFSTLHYDLQLSVDYENQKVIGTCALTFLHTDSLPTHELPLLLYRLMRVRSVRDYAGTPLSFKQTLVEFDDVENLQVRFGTVDLKREIKCGETDSVIVEYEGMLSGYREVGWLYVQDHVDSKFTILRPDCLAFPEIGYPSRAANGHKRSSEFSYRIQVTVPESLIVANNGKLISKKTSGGLATYCYENIKPCWRMDVTTAKYQVLERGGNHVFYFPEDSVGAERLMEALQKSIDLFTDWWGGLNDFQGFSVIEIPDGYGSQADVTGIMQTASAFRDQKELHQLYHEISHQWNVTSNDQFPPRWEEGLATFVEYLLVEKIEKRDVLPRVSDWMLGQLREELKQDTASIQVPLIDYGRRDIAGRSYSAGMILFQVLYAVIGAADFNKIMAEFYCKYEAGGATTAQFVDLMKEVSHTDLTAFCNDWIMTPKYVDYVQNGMTVPDMIKLYTK